MEGASAVPTTAREESAADAPVRDLTCVVAGVAAGLSAVFHRADVPHVLGVAGWVDRRAGSPHGVRHAGRGRAGRRMASFPRPRVLRPGPLVRRPGWAGPARADR